jgi:hypothetical protein
MEDMRLIKKLKEDTKLNWQYFPYSSRSYASDKLQDSFPVAVWVLLKSSIANRRGNWTPSHPRRYHVAKSCSLQIETLRKLIKENAKAFWNDIGAKMGKSGSGCQHVAKENLHIIL